MRAFILAEEAIVAFDVEFVLRLIGAERIICAYTIEDALKQVKAADPDVILVEWQCTQGPGVLEMLMPNTQILYFGKNIPPSHRKTKQAILRSPIVEEELRTALMAGGDASR